MKGISAFSPALIALNREKTKRMADELDRRANMFEGIGADEYTVFRDAAMRMRALQDENDALRQRIDQLDQPPF